MAFCTFGQPIGRRFALKHALRKVHRLISLVVVFFWMVQAATGLLIVFQNELDALAIPEGASSPASFGAVEAGLHDVLKRPDVSRISSAYAMNEDFNEFDVYIVLTDGSYNVLRVDAEGHILRELPSNPEVLDAGFFELVLELHTKLWAGSFGHYIVGVSGILLVSNLLIGLKLAWPKRGNWKRALSVPKKATGASAMYGFHRALGLVFVVPALLFMGAGAILSWEDLLTSIIGAPQPAPEVSAVDKLSPIGLDIAVEKAQETFPGSQVSVFTLPTTEKPYYRIRLLQDGELRRLYGNTNVYIDAVKGNVLGADDALAAPVGQRFLDSLYPIHNGGAFGLLGRLALFLTGALLIIMMVLGIRLWMLRRG